MAKSDKDRDEWIKETQMFQRIAGTPESSFDELAHDWNRMNPTVRRRAHEHMSTHRIIQDAAIRAGKGRQS